jgi:hypothetical protein
MLKSKSKNYYCRQDTKPLRKEFVGFENEMTPLK